MKSRRKSSSTKVGCISDDNDDYCRCVDVGGSGDVKTSEKLWSLTYSPIVDQICVNECCSESKWRSTGRVLQRKKRLTRATSNKQGKLWSEH